MKLYLVLRDLFIKRQEVSVILKAVARHLFEDGCEVMPLASNTHYREDQPQIVYYVMTFL